MFRMLDPEDMKANPGDALINAGACFPDIERLKRRFDVMIFLDLCVGLEAAVLHNTLHCIGLTFGEPNPALTALVRAGFAEEYDGFFPPDRQSLADIQTYVQQSKRLQQIAEQFPMRPLDASMIPPANPPKPVAGESPEDFSRRLRDYAMNHARDVQAKMVIATPDDLPAPARWEVMTASWRILNLAGLERVKSIPTAHAAHALPDLRRDAAVTAEDEIKRALDSLSAEGQTITKKYEELQLLLISERVGQEAAGRREVLRMPPIAFDVLRRVSSLDGVGQAVLDVRDEYRYARQLFTDWDQVLRSPDASMKEKRETERQVKKAWDEFMRPQPAGWVECCTALADRLELAMKVTDPKNWPGMFRYLAGLPESISWRFYLRPLQATRNWYEEATLNDLHEVVTRHFGHQLTMVELRQARAFLTGSATPPA